METAVPQHSFRASGSVGITAYTPAGQQTTWPESRHSRTPQSRTVTIALLAVLALHPVYIYKLAAHRMPCFFPLTKKTPCLWECGFHGRMKTIVSKKNPACNVCLLPMRMLKYTVICNLLSLFNAKKNTTSEPFLCEEKAEGSRPYLNHRRKIPTAIVWLRVLKH